jgi:hypothetical protein
MDTAFWQVVIDALVAEEVTLDDVVLIAQILGRPLF